VSEINVIHRAQHIIVDPPSRNIEVVNVAAPGSTSGIPPLEDWIALPLLNGWAIYGAEFETPAYMKDPFGFVHMKGLIRHDTDRTKAIGLLPLGYRPAHTMSWVVGTAATTPSDLRIGGVGSVQGDGMLQLIGVTGGASHCFLDAVYFKAR